MIRQSYDLDADALYIKLTDDVVVRSVEVDAGTLVDLDAQDKPVGIEVIQPMRNWPLGEIISRFRVSKSQVQELQAYFPSPPHTSLPEKYPAPMHPRTPPQSVHPGLDLRVAVF